jgi:hypothetical protein
MSEGALKDIFKRLKEEISLVQKIKRRNKFSSKD